MPEKSFDFRSLAVHFPDDGGLRVTDAGLWHATPLDVVFAAVRALADAGALRGVRRVLDLGAGDGRWLAVLAAHLEGAVVAGLEHDASLASSAADALRALGSSARVARGDFFDPEDLAAVGTPSGTIDLALNYPDGNEGALLAWLDAHGAPDASLAVVSGELRLRLSREAEWRADLVRAAGPPWHLAVFRRRSASR